MPETIPEILKNGFNSWKSNLSVTGIYILYYVVFAIPAICLGVAVIYPVTKTSVFQTILNDPESILNAASTDPISISPLAETMIEELSASYFITTFAALIIFLIVIVILDVIFMTGIYEMALDATVGQKCSISSFIRGIRTKLFRVFLALIASAVCCAIISSAVNSILGVIAVPFYMAGSSYLEIISPVITIISRFLLVALSFPFTLLISSAIAETDMTPTESVSAGFACIFGNVKDVLRFGAVMGLIAAILSIISLAGFPGIVLSAIFSGLVVTPMTIFWSVRYYMAKNGLFDRNEYDLDENF